MRFKILSLVMRIPEAEFLLSVAKNLIDNKMEIEFVVGHEAAVDIFQKNGLKCYNIHKLVRQLNNKINAGCMLTDIKDIQEKYRIDNIRSLYFREMLNFRRFDEENMLVKTLKYLNIMQEILKESKPGLVVQETGDFIAPISLYYVTKSMNINHVFIEPSILLERVVFTLNNLYSDMPSSLFNYSSSLQEKKLIGDYMQNYVDNKTIAMPKKDKKFFKDMKISALINTTNLKKLRRKLFHKYITRKSEEYNAIGWYCLWHLLRMIRRKALNKTYLKELPKQQYIYFPFHVPLDLQLTTRCPEYLDQLSLIEYISRCMPIGCLLVIKEHPASIGAYPYLRLKNILKYNRNVRLLHPGMNSYDIIRNSKCVITINSKVGAEAIMQQKPVVVIGETFYKNKGLTIDVKYPKDLPKAINEALNSKPLDIEKVKDFFVKVYKWSWPGELFYNSQDNIRKFSDSLLSFIKEYNLH